MVKAKTKRSNSKTRNKWFKALFLLGVTDLWLWLEFKKPKLSSLLSSTSTTITNTPSDQDVIHSKESMMDYKVLVGTSNIRGKTQQDDVGADADDVGSCSNIRYPDLTKSLSSPSQNQANSQFMAALNVPEPLNDILLVNRYRFEDGVQVPVPKALRLFDWLVLEAPLRVVNTPVFPTTTDTHEGGKPIRSVYCDPHSLQLCLEKANSLLPPLTTTTSPSATKDGLDKRILAIGNDDLPRLDDQIEIIRQLMASQRFSKILIEPKNIRMDGIGSLPIGLNNMYIQELNGGPGALLRTIRSASLLGKTGSVLAAWGGRYGMLDRMIESRIEATKFASTSCVAPRRMIDPKDYMDVLSQYRFLLAPTGNGIFTPKVMEALLVLTIPIVQRKPDSGAWEDLRDVYGWPIVIVDQWDEITPHNLVKWWTELAPKLNAARLRLLPDAWFETVMSQ